MKQNFAQVNIMEKVMDRTCRVWTSPTLWSVVHRFRKEADVNTEHGVLHQDEKAEHYEKRGGNICRERSCLI